MKTCMGRIGYIDAMKGFLILCVLYHHVEFFLLGKISFLDVQVQVFFMPLFFSFRVSCHRHIQYLLM